MAIRTLSSSKPSETKSFLQQHWEDDALVKIWGYFSQANPIRYPAMNDVEHIKAWLKDPSHELKIKYLVINKEITIKAIPPQLADFPYLKLLIIESDIDFKPEWIEKKTDLICFLGKSMITTMAIQIHQLHLGFLGESLLSQKPSFKSGLEKT